MILWNWMAVAALLAFVLFVEKRDLESIGLIRPERHDIQWAIMFWASP